MSEQVVIYSPYYRISAKALILDPTRTKFLIVKEANGKWELPGGGMNWEEDAESCVKREIREEMGLEVLSVAPQPRCFLTFPFLGGGWGANLVFETTVRNLNFTPSEECQEIRFVGGVSDLADLDCFPNVLELVRKFKQ